MLGGRGQKFPQGQPALHVSSRNKKYNAYHVPVNGWFHPQEGVM